MSKRGWSFGVRIELPTGLRALRTRGPMTSCAGESGFALIETVTAITLFAFVAAAISGLLMSGTVAVRFASQRTLAEQAAAAQIDTIRALGYGAIGTVNGNPGGNLPVTSAVPGLPGTTQTLQVTWVNDPAPTAYVSYADYKRVTVAITRNSDSALLSKQSTYVGPSSVAGYGGLANGIINPQVIDMGNSQPMAGVTVSVSGGPSGASSDITAIGTGKALFPGLTPNPTSGAQQYYNLAVTPPAGYTALADDVSPNTPAHVKLAAGQTFSPVLRIYQPATVNVAVTAGGSTYTGAGTVTLTSSRPTLTTSLASGSAQFTGVVPSVSYTANVAITGVPTPFSSAPQTVPTAYPTNLTSNYSIALPYLVVTVWKKTGSTCGTVDGATVKVTSSTPQSINMSATTTAGTAAFVVPAGTKYTIKVTSGTSVTLTNQTVAAAPATTNISTSISGTCP